MMSVQAMIKQIRVMYYAVFGGMVAFTLGSLFIILSRGAFADLSPIQATNLQSVVLLLVFAGIPGAHYYHRKKCKNLPEEMDLLSKLAIYKTGFVIKQMVFEGLCLLGLMVYILTASHIYIIVASVCIVTQLINYPSITRISEDLGVEAHEFDEK
jgi:hypothetical protein